MRYQPTDRPDRGHVGEKWTRYQLRSMQIILQATHGIVSGEPTFFKRAFGDTVADYRAHTAPPHDFIFNRDWYERFDQRGAALSNIRRSSNAWTALSGGNCSRSFPPAIRGIFRTCRARTTPNVQKDTAVLPAASKGSAV